MCFFKFRKQGKESFSIVSTRAPPKKPPALGEGDNVGEKAERNVYLFCWAVDPGMLEIRRGAQSGLENVEASLSPELPRPHQRAISN